MSAILSATATRSQMPHSYSLPHGSIQDTTDHPFIETMETGLEYLVESGSDESDLEESDPVKFGLGSSVGTDSESQNALSFTMSDWLSDISENDLDICKLVDSMGKPFWKSYSVQVDSSWYPFPNKEVSLLWFYLQRLF